MQQQTFDTCTAFVIVPAFALPHYVYVRSPALHIAYCIALRLAIALLIIIIMQCYCVTQNCIPARAMRLYLGWVLRCAYYILHCYVYCAFAQVHCGPTQAKPNITLIHCCTFAHFAILHAVLRSCVQLQHLRSALLQAKLITLRIVWLVLPFPLLPYSSIVARIRL